MIDLLRIDAPTLSRMGQLGRQDVAQRHDAHTEARRLKLLIEPHLTAESVGTRETPLTPATSGEAVA
jgi:hypothetical protein